MSFIQEVAKKWLSDIRWFSHIVVRRPLYNYQLEPARAIIDSVVHKRGLEFAVLFPRQSGKNETQSQLEGYLLNLFQRVGGGIVKGQPTRSPQGVNAMMRLERVLQNDWDKGRWKKREGYIFQLGQALAFFLTADPQASVVGATASLLLECDEAQDVLESVWGAKFEPMAASTNATSVLWGTAWTSSTLLAKTIKRLRVLEAVDGVKRVFVVTPAQVTAENPAYGEFVKRQLGKYGREHPFVKTQLFNEEIDSQGGMFPVARRALMRGTHPRERIPSGKIYAFLFDVAGEDEGAVATVTDAADVEKLQNPARDSDFLTIVEVDLSTLSDELIHAPTYRVVERKIWTGTKHTILYGAFRALALLWQPRFIVVDATGVGKGLATFLDQAFAGRVVQFVFNGATKSQLGWDFLTVIETGRFKDWAVPEVERDVEAEIFVKQLEFVKYEAGLNQTLKWGVPSATRDPQTGELVHDDGVLSAALVAMLDVQDWSQYGAPQVVLAQPIDESKRQRGKY
jgi:hypothetical protein